MHNRLKILFTFLLLVVIAGCMIPGQQLESSAISQLHQGQTQEEVRQIFGKPVESSAVASGNTLDLFQVVFTRKTSNTTGKIEIRSLHVLYNGQGRVEKFYSHIGLLNGYARLYGKWTAGRPFPAEKVNNIQRRLTTHDELIEIFGPATIEGLDVQGNRGTRWYFLEGTDWNKGQGRELAVIFDEDLVVRDFMVRVVNK